MATRCLLWQTNNVFGHTFLVITFLICLDAIFSSGSHEEGSQREDVKYLTFT